MIEKVPCRGIFFAKLSPKGVLNITYYKVDSEDFKSCFLVKILKKTIFEMIKIFLSRFLLSSKKRIQDRHGPKLVMHTFCDFLPSKRALPNLIAFNCFRWNKPKKNKLRQHNLFHIMR